MPRQSSVSPDRAKALYDYLYKHAYGKANAIRSRNLIRELHLGAHGDRWLRTAVNVAAENGLLVSTGNGGYWIPANFEELEEMMRRISGQIAKMSRRLSLVQQLAQRKFHFKLPTRRPTPAPEEQLRIF